MFQFFYLDLSLFFPHVTFILLFCCYWSDQSGKYIILTCIIYLNLFGSYNVVADIFLCWFEFFEETWAPHLSHVYIYITMKIFQLHAFTSSNKIIDSQVKEHESFIWMSIKKVPHNNFPNFDKLSIEQSFLIGLAVETIFKSDMHTPLIIVLPCHNIWVGKSDYIIVARKTGEHFLICLYECQCQLAFLLFVSPIKTIYFLKILKLL